MGKEFKTRLTSREVLIGAQLRFGSPAIAEQFGHAGFDCLWIDGEHAPQSPEGVFRQLQAVAAAGHDTTTLVRLGRIDPDEIRLYLDMGAHGIVTPMVGTPEQAKAGAEACRYPPRGTRSYGPFRAAAYGFTPDYFRGADDGVLYMPIVETKEGLERLPEILAVPGVDCVVVGLVDLSISLGVPFEMDGSTMVDAMESIGRQAADSGKPAGIGMYGDLLDPESYRRFTGMGYTLLLAGGDEWSMAAGCRGLVSAFRTASGARS